MLHFGGSTLTERRNNMNITPTNWTGMVIGFIVYLILLAVLIHKVRNGTEKAVYASGISFTMAICALLATNPLVQKTTTESGDMNWSWALGYMILLCIMSFGVHRLVSWRLRPTD